jgi:hypothetical protein
MLKNAHQLQEKLNMVCRRVQCLDNIIFIIYKESASEYQRSEDRFICRRYKYFSNSGKWTHPAAKDKQGHE